MLLEEWNMEDAIAYARKEGREDGIEFGMAKGRYEGRAEGRYDGQDYILELLDQGFSTDEIKQRIYSERKST